MTKPSAQAVLDELRRRGPAGLSDLEALDACGTTRLAARIWELRAEGHRVDGTLETTASGKRYSRYVLVEAVRAGTPIGRLRVCPSCRREHEVGTTCAFVPTAVDGWDENMKREAWGR